MISNVDAIILIAITVASIAFMLWCFFPTKKKMFLIHKMYFALCATFVWWSLVLVAMKYTDPSNSQMLFVWDALTYPGVAFSPVLMLMVAMSFVTGAEHMPRKWWLLFIVPTITNIIVWTNPYHHLQYQVFSVIRSELVFGPYLYIHGAYNYICTVVAIVLMLRFARHNRNSIYVKQCTLFVIGDTLPLLVSMTATFGWMEMSISATPLSFISVLIFHYFAIYRLHMLDIKPIATQHVLNWISDCYLLLSDQGLVMSSNQPFKDVFGASFGISENRFLCDCVREEDIVGRTAIYSLLTSVESCRVSGSAISYEQSVNLPTGNDEYQKSYYIIDITPLFIKNELSGFVVICKDFTQVKKSMQQVQESQRHMMEQERLAFLGQMMGGLAHNLKTPIMSISGCMSAVDALLQECEESLGDPEVTPDDYREIFAEVNDWVLKTQDSCTYMSDIITAIKGQATNITGSKQSAFTLDELIKRSSLLMRHELISASCQLISEYEGEGELILNGDINNLVQVINNLVSNAIYAEKQTGGNQIYLGMERRNNEVDIYVRDTGPGVSERVRKRLFKEMITNKGAAGTGLGLFISNAVVQGKFGGSMWVKDNPGGGSIFGFTVPLAENEENDTPTSATVIGEKAVTR